ncbi:MULTISPECIES: hypothetical protein [Flavobacteriaceae]|uniref:Restriction endonuclease n=2 Tax=Flavobacteriaceae TaxID=49546 RepID=A0A936ZWH8_9FLAO|nr:MULTISPECIES: hypothetical protein [Flavobacteriaceae]MBL0682321.1 hypothetical protein [Aquimarina mytili]RTE54224.1 hypothetical protein EHW67_03390 [Arenibacter aquaticus]
MKLFARFRNKLKKLFQKNKQPEYEVTQFVFSDRQRIDDKSTISFFLNNPKPDVSVTRTFESEDATVNWLMDNNDFRKMLFENLFPASNSVKYHCGIKEPVTVPNKMPGDIDILLFEDGKPENTIGIECKIVKSESSENKPPKINKVNSVQKKGTQQANGYGEIGFSRVYLMVILLDDGRHYKNPNVMFRSTPTEWLDELYGFDWDSRLDSDIGIIYTHVNQFTSNHINQTKGLGLRVERKAVTKQQDEGLTEKIQSLT